MGCNEANNALYGWRVNKQRGGGTSNRDWWPQTN